MFSFGIPSLCGGDDDEKTTSTESIAATEDHTQPPPPPDTDNDGVIDSEDNAPTVVNQDQTDSDNDGSGDASDTDDDNDGTSDDKDDCPYNENNTCDSNVDKDEDGIENTTDNCPDIQNADQKDQDGDTIGDLCDDDIDGDTKNNEEDNCPYTSNPNQEDVDEDQHGDACDTSDDRKLSEDNDDSTSENALIDIYFQYMSTDDNGTTYESYKIYCSSETGIAYCGQLTDDPDKRLNAPLISGNTFPYDSIERIVIGGNEIILRTDIISRTDLIDTIQEIISRTDMTDPMQVRLGITTRIYNELYLNAFTELNESTIDLYFNVPTGGSSNIAEPTYEEKMQATYLCMQDVTKKPADRVQNRVKNKPQSQGKETGTNSNSVGFFDQFEYACAGTHLGADGRFLPLSYYTAEIVEKYNDLLVYKCTINQKIQDPQNRIQSMAIIWNGKQGTSAYGTRILDGVVSFREATDSNKFIQLLRNDLDFFKIDRLTKSSNFEYSTNDYSHLDNFNVGELILNYDRDNNRIIDIFDGELQIIPQQCLQK